MAYQPPSSCGSSRNDARSGAQQPTTTGAPQYTSTLRVDPINHTGMEDFHQGQMDYYFKGYRNGPPAYETEPVPAAPSRPPTDKRPYTPSQYSAADRKATTRKPVPPTKPEPKVGPTPPSNARPVSAEEIGLKAPAPCPQQPASPGASRYIGTRKDGRFDPNKEVFPAEGEQPAFKEPRHTAGPQHARPKGKVPPPINIPPRPTGPEPAPASSALTPTTSSPHGSASTDKTFSPGLERSSTGSSLHNFGQNVKRAASSIRRRSIEFADGVVAAVDVALMRADERAKYEAVRARAVTKAQRGSSEERQQKCQQWKEAVDEGKEDAYSPNPHVRLPSDLHDAMRMERNERGAKVKAWNERVESGKEDPNSPNPHAALPANHADAQAMYATEHGHAHPRYSHGQASRGLNRWERAGLKIGETFIDPVRRKGSDESTWMSDPAVPEAMAVCDVCGRAPDHNLYYGRCERCIRCKTPTKK